MRLLFIHPNFPAQYRHLARHYGAQQGNDVVCVGQKPNASRVKTIPGTRLFGYDLPAFDAGSGDDKALRSALHRARAVAYGATELKRSGFRPDVIFAHIGWGDALFIKDVFPESRLLLYCEFFYRFRGSNFGFDTEFEDLPESHTVRMINAPFLISLNASDWGVSATRWQHNQFPAEYRPRISVIHDGVHTDIVKPNPAARFRVPGTEVVLSPEDEVVTYVARSLEPYRGFHIFMRAIPEIQRRRPKARIVIVGGDEVDYSHQLPPGETYRQRMLRELEGKIDYSRVYMPGRVDFPDYVALLQVSGAHVYLTYPFVLSWSLIEAMSAGCLVVASRTAPVEEVVVDGENGLLVDFFSPEGIAARVDQALDQGDALQPIRDAARRTAVKDFDLQRICLPAHIRLIEQLASGQPPAAGGQAAFSGSSPRSAA